MSFRDLEDWKAASPSFSGMAASATRSFALSEGGEAERFSGAAISWDLFPTLGVQPVLGRQFTSEDDRPGAEPVALISDAGRWQRRYATDPGIIGRRMHDGSLASLDQVVDYYDRGGNRNAWLDPELRPLGLAEAEKSALVAFLRSLSGPTKN